MRNAPCATKNSVVQWEVYSRAQGMVSVSGEAGLCIQCRQHRHVSINRELTNGNVIGVLVSRESLARCRRIKWRLHTPPPPRRLNTHWHSCQQPHTPQIHANNAVTTTGVATRHAGCCKESAYYNNSYQRNRIYWKCVWIRWDYISFTLFFYCIT